MADRLIVTPAEQARMGVQTLQRLRDSRDRHIPLLMPEIGDCFAPLLPGEMCMVLAQTHNGKSRFMRHWASRVMAHLSDNGRDEIVVWVDTETPADYLATAQLAQYANLNYTEVLYGSRGLDIIALERAAAQVAGNSPYTIATRLGSKDGGAEVHLSNIKSGLALLRDGRVDGVKHRIAAVFVDYLQALPIDPTVKRSPLEMQRRLQVFNDVNTLRVMASSLDCPAIVGVQAKQDLMTTDMSKHLGLPGSLSDGMETYGIGQRTDRLLSLSVPARSYGSGKILEYHNARFQVRPELTFVAALKQRAIFGYLPVGDVFAFEMVDTPDSFQAYKHVWSEWTP